MTLRTAANPMPALLRTQWQTRLAAYIGVAYNSLSDLQKQEIDFYVDETHEAISKRMGHEPWALREWPGLAVTPSDPTFLLPADVRHVMDIEETDGVDEERLGILTTKQAYVQAKAQTVHGMHPWATQHSNPRYFFDGMDDSDPPRQQWRRVPDPDRNLTIKVHGRPYFDVVALFNELPASVRAETLHTLRAKWAAFSKQYDAAAVEQQFADRAIETSQINDNPTGAAEASIVVAPPTEFDSEMYP